VVVRRSLLMLCLLSMVFCSASCSAEPIGETKRDLEKPHWRVGDSWAIKCPLVSATPYSEGWVKIGEYTVIVSVLENRRVAEQDCYVLDIRPRQEDRSMMLSQGWDNLECYRVLYRVDDLTLMRLESYQLTGDRIGAPHLSITATPKDPKYAPDYHAYIPVLLPRFPVKEGGSSERFHKEYAEPKGEAEKDRDAATSMRLTSSAKVPGSDDKMHSVKGALTVVFTETYVKSKTGDHSRRVIEQTWIPGKPWWSVAREFSVFNEKYVEEYCLLEAGTPTK